MTSKIIITATVFLLIASFAILFVVETKNRSLDYKKSWTAVYFDNPRDNSLDFSIENYEGRGSQYSYKILAGNDKLFEEEIEIEAGDKWEISPNIEETKLSGKNISINVSYKDKDYKIYKVIGD